MNKNTIIQLQQLNINIHTNFKMLSEMFEDDLKSFGRTLGIQPDDVQFYI